MTKEERLSGSRLIGEFVGKSFSMSHISDYKGCSNEALPQMRYHCDWNWIMKAWYMFRDLRFNSEMITYDANIHQHSYFKDTISRAICYEDITNTFLKIIDAIKWYNNEANNSNP